MIPEEQQPAASWADDRLVRECLGGNEEAWGVLIHRYKRLIYSIPFKYGATPDDAADIFQGVCLELFSNLAKLRNTESLRSWLMTITIHKSYHWKKQLRPAVELDGLEPDQADAISSSLEKPQWLDQTEREQIVREAIGQLSPRCGEMMRLLFYHEPPLPYAEVARRLGLATGSIGFIRGRCLKKLERVLVDKGF